MNTIIQLNKEDLFDVSVISRDIGSNLKDGQVLLEIDKFSFTANNITYAVMGDRMQYWNFFPTDEGKGIIPVWGFANVTKSNCEGIQAGERLYGYFPMAEALVVEPVKVSPTSFIDGAEHRKQLPVIYNQYIRSAQDPIYKLETEAFQMLLRPLFTTSFLLDDFFESNDFFGADAISLTSASSKTAYGMAFLLKNNRDQRGKDYKIIGFTSPSNIDFVESLGCYDVVLPYEGVTSLDPQMKLANVDFAGNGTVLSSIHSHFGDNLKYSCLVGASHWDQRSGFGMDLPGASPVLFFAPSQGQKRIAEWGSAGFQQRLGSVWNLFVAFAGSHINVTNHNGSEAVTSAYKKVLSGEAKPDEGYILSMTG